MAENIYDFFDDIVCINICDMKNAKKHINGMYKKYNISGRFYITQKHPIGDIYCRFNSHINIIKEAYNNNMDNILIFEDTVVPSIFYSKELLQNAIDFMKNNNNWDIFFLGYDIIAPVDRFNTDYKSIFSSIKVSNHIIKFNSSSSYAVCYNRNSMQKILEEYEYYVGIVNYHDFLAAKMNFKCYCITPILFDSNFLLKSENDTINFDIIYNKIYSLIAIFKINQYISFLHHKISIGNTQEYLWFYKYTCVIMITILMNIVKKSITRNYNILI